MSLEIIPRSDRPLSASVMPLPAPPADTWNVTPRFESWNVWLQLSAIGYTASAPEIVIEPVSGTGVGVGDAVMIEVGAEVAVGEEVA